MILYWITYILTFLLGFIIGANKQEEIVESTKEFVKKKFSKPQKLGGINRKPPQELNKPEALKRAEAISEEIIERDIGDDVLQGV